MFAYSPRKWLILRIQGNRVTWCTVPFCLLRIDLFVDYTAFLLQYLALLFFIDQNIFQRHTRYFLPSSIHPLVILIPSSLSFQHLVFFIGLFLVNRQLRTLPIRPLVERNLEGNPEDSMRSTKA
ncbi:hypothetical protein F4780DRAFT_344859 [Xylariomycetidae sp. FL0641]|nr:hypothetical protein F4780DRAFT_344859 [Xylariomycetidae sp. FL0641]